MTCSTALGWAAAVCGVAGVVVQLGRTWRTDEVGRGLFLWMVLAWLGVALLVGTEVTSTAFAPQRT